MKNLFLILTLITNLSCGLEQPPLSIQNVLPSQIVVETPSTLTILGSFYTPIGADLNTGVQYARNEFTVMLGEDELPGVVLISSEELEVFVPPGFPIGTYDLSVEDPLGRQAILEDAVAIVPFDSSRPVIEIIEPAADAQAFHGATLHVVYHVTDQPPGMIRSVHWRVAGSIKRNEEIFIEEPTSEYEGEFRIDIEPENTANSVIILITAFDDSEPANQGSARREIPITNCSKHPDCDNGFHCDGVEYCTKGRCIDGTTVECIDSFDCTDDSCDEETDSCIHEPNHSRCQDMIFCNGEEICHETYGCIRGFPPCEDYISCTEDRCIEGLEFEGDHCEHIPRHDLCDNGIFCDGEEQCSLGYGCMDGQSPCDDHIDCTIDRCNESLQECTNNADNSRCDDFDECTTNMCSKEEGCLFEDGREEFALGDTCNDGIDNDCNKLTDAEDPKCLPE